MMFKSLEGTDAEKKIEVENIIWLQTNYSSEKCKFDSDYGSASWYGCHSFWKKIKHGMNINEDWTLNRIEQSSVIKK